MEIKTEMLFEIVLRGGAWSSWVALVTYRDRYINERDRLSDLGFRLVRIIKTDRQVNKWREELEEGLFNEK